MSLQRALDKLRGSAAQPVPGLDFHCHLIPGVDDGVRTLEETRATIAGLRALGYRGAVVTPHIYPGVYDNTVAGLRDAFATLQHAIGTDYPMWLAAEYHTNDGLFPLIEQGDLLHVALGGTRVVLAEFPYLMPAPRGLEALAALRRAGWQPVLAHVERYRYIAQDPEPWLAHLRELDVWLQCNVGSLAGMYGPQPQAFARRLLQRGLPVLWASDVHRPMQVQRYIAPGLRQLAGLERINALLDPLVTGAPGGQGAASAFAVHAGEVGHA
jgi:tyrosine-protein phosphatase YwqE